MLYKKRWSDGLHDDFEHLDEFEFKHGCFGGDGGRNGGGDGSNDDSEKPSPAPRDTVASQPMTVKNRLLSQKDLGRGTPLHLSQKILLVT